ncbi:MAG: hypothetical protein FJ395_09625 [Verrucomicrobia bacterium]|nr:hypothetical protein [Verrucomicrobiota bacterium]
MKTKLLVSLCVATAFAVAIALAQDKESTKPDPRIDKLLEQHQQILKNQTQILERLDKIEQGLLQVRRRTS